MQPLFGVGGGVGVLGAPVEDLGVCAKGGYGGEVGGVEGVELETAGWDGGKGLERGGGGRRGRWHCRRCRCCCTSSFFETRRTQGKGGGEGGALGEEGREGDHWVYIYSMCIYGAL